MFRNSPSSLRDELALQAWLARAELRQPSLHSEVSALAWLRDELRLQAHLGHMEAMAELDALDSHWVHLQQRLGVLSEPKIEDVAEVLRHIRTGYEQLRARFQR